VFPGHAASDRYDAEVKRVFRDTLMSKLMIIQVNDQPTRVHTAQRRVNPRLVALPSGSSSAGVAAAQAHLPLDSAGQLCNHGFVLVVFPPILPAGNLGRILSIRLNGMC